MEIKAAIPYFACFFLFFYLTFVVLMSKNPNTVSQIWLKNMTSKKKKGLQMRNKRTPTYTGSSNSTNK